MRRLSLFIIVLACFGVVCPIANGDGQPQASLLLLPFRPIGETQQYGWIGDAIDQSFRANLSDNGSARILPRPGEAIAEDAAAQRDAARHAGASLLLSGSYQIVGDRLRISGALMDVASGDRVGSLLSTGSVRNLFDMEDELAGQLNHALGQRSPATASAPYPPTYDGGGGYVGSSYSEPYPYYPYPIDGLAYAPYFAPPLYPFFGFNSFFFFDFDRHHFFDHDRFFDRRHDFDHDRFFDRHHDFDHGRFDVDRHMRDHFGSQFGRGSLDNHFDRFGFSGSRSFNSPRSFGSFHNSPMFSRPFMGRSFGGFGGFHGSARGFMHGGGGFGHGGGGFGHGGGGRR